MSIVEALRVCTGSVIDGPISNEITDLLHPEDTCRHPRFPPRIWMPEWPEEACYVSTKFVAWRIGDWRSSDFGRPPGTSSQAAIAQ
jgi:hypothetical protein